MRNNALILTILLLLLCLGSALAQKQEVKNNITYKVPTTGKIIDVDYWLEFQEWWIKCREGAGIAIYTYDKDNEAWGKVKFVPLPRGEASKVKKPEEKPFEKESPKTEKQDKAQDNKKVIQSDKDGAEESSEKDGKGEDTPARDNHENQETLDKGRWWDPLDIIKKGKNLVAPDSEDSGTKMPPIEPSNSGE